MRAVVMAGGEGTRLRPLTSGLPKPLLPVVNRPIMEHVLRLLKLHGFDETVVTVAFLAPLVRSFFGDGRDLGMTIRYATEEAPLGTAGSVRNAAEALQDETFLVISGDAITDIDLGALLDHHRRTGALVTVCLSRVSEPVDYGVTVLEPDGRVGRFVEKPGWGQVFSDTVNTGIYVMEPEVFAYVPPGRAVDWSGEVFPRLVQAGAEVQGYVADGYWEDVGTLERYLRVNRDCLDRRVAVDLNGFEVAPGVFVGEGAEIDTSVRLSGPLMIGRHSKVEAGAVLRDHCVVGDNVVIRDHAFLHRAVVHDNVYLGTRANLRACVVARGSDIMRRARVEENAVVGDHCIVEDEAVVGPGVTVYPGKTVEAGATVHSSVVWESRGHRSLFGPRGVSGIVNVETTPELVVRLASAHASLLPKSSTVVTARDASRAARALKRAAIAAYTAGSMDVRDLELAPLPLLRHALRRTGEAGIYLRTTEGDAESVDIVLLGDDGADIGDDERRALDRIYGRGEFRRAFPGQIGDLTFPARVADDYIDDLMAAVDSSGVAAADLRVVVDAGHGAAPVLLPRLLGRLGVEAFSVNTGIDEARPTESPADHQRELGRLGELVASSGADFGVRFDRVGERLSLVDDSGRVVDDGRVLLVLLDLVAAEAGHGAVALPVTATRVAEQVTRFHGVTIRWTGTGPDALARAVRAEPLLLAGDGRGGFVVPRVGPGMDAFAALTMLLGLVARTKLRLSEIDARIPRTALLRTDVPTAWSDKGTVMRRAAEAAGSRTVDITDGIRVVEADGSWCLLMPDPGLALTRLWAEAPDETAARDLLRRWSEVVTGRPG